MKRATVFVVLDGFGIGRRDATNPIHLANPANINYIKQNYLSGALQASGIAVGLPWGEVGNSEVGHITLGAGKVVYQHYPRISLTIKDGGFFKNNAIALAFTHAEKNNSGVNLIGLLSEGNVHASFEHLEALIKSAKRTGVKKLNIHIITDGKDSAPKSAPELIKKLRAVMEENKIGAIASISGRYYALDRDEHYDRTGKAYAAITGQGSTADNIETYLQTNYAKDLDDQFIEPATLSKENCVKENDAIIFFDFREDGIRQIASCFASPEFSQFPVISQTALAVTTFTEYSPAFNATVAFPEENIERPLGAVLADAGKVQLRIAETEKYAHVTYFFNALKTDPFKNEYRVLIPSQNVARHDEHPEMMAQEIASRAIAAINEGATDFILINFANADVVAHTGNIDATIKAINTLDLELRRIFDAVLANNGVLIITSDHGNAEQMANPLTGAPETKHNLSAVPIYIAGKEFVSVKTEKESEEAEREICGILSDVAPTVLEIIKIDKPANMTGESLLGLLK